MGITPIVRPIHSGKTSLVASLLILALYLQSLAFLPPEVKARPIVSTVAQSNDTIVVYGPRQIDRTGPLTKFSEQFTMPADAVAPFNIQIVNGALDGTSRALTATVRLNGAVVADSSQLNLGVPSVTRPVQLAANNTIDGNFFGRPGAFITITITATRGNSSTPPTISDFSPKQGSPGTIVTLTGSFLKLSNTNPAVTFGGNNNSRQAAQIISSITTEVRITVPNGAQTGFIELTTANGLAKTATPFTVQDSQDFQLNVAPGTVSTIQRSTATQIVAITSPQPNFSQLARLAVTGLPAGVTFDFEPDLVAAGASSTLSLNLANVNLSPGSYSFTVSATAVVDGHDVQRTFPASLNVIAAGQTSITGVVLSNEKQPIIGATASLDGHSATTDSAGVFLLSGVTAGQNRPVMIDGRTASAPNKTYPVIVEPANVVAGQVNTVPFTFYLPALDTQFEKVIVPNQATVVDNPRLPDLAMTVPANANLRNLDGTPVTRVSISPVEPDRVPAPLPANLGSNMVYTSQPGGAVSSGNMAIPVTYPNLAGADPNTRIELYYFDHNAVVWKRYGLGRVSTDGLRIVPENDPATGRPFGLPDFSWHFPNVTPNDNPAPDDDCQKAGGGGSKCDEAKDKSCPRGPKTVDFSTGVKIEKTTDISFGGARGLLELTRTYTSDLGLSCTTCPFGRGTTHNWDIRLTGAFAAGGTGRVKLAEQVAGRLFSFNAASSTLQGLSVFTTRSTTGQLGDEVRRLSSGSLVYRRRDGSSMTFNSSGRLTSMSDTNNNTVTLIYTGNNLTSVTDAVGRSINFTYDSSNRITRITDPLGHNWDYSYTSAGTLGQVKDPFQNVTTYTYGGTLPGQLIAVKDKRGNTLKQITYDSVGRVTDQKFADGGVEHYAYTLSGNAITGATITDALNRVQTKRFNVAGYVTDYTDELGQKNHLERSMDNNLTASVTGPCGCTEEQYEYDDRGNIIKSTDRLGGVKRMEYDPVFNKLTKITDELGRVTTFAYDSHGNMLLRRDALGRTTAYSYDGFGQLTTITDPLHHTRNLEYDAQGNVIAVLDAFGNRSTFESDAIGRLTATVDPLGRRATFVYDSLDRVTSMTDTAGATTTLAYDSNDNLISFTNALNQRWTSAYDSKDRLISTTDPLGRVSRWFYDRDDQLVARVSPSGRTTRYTYDSRGLLETMTTPLGFVTHYEYDNSGNLVTLTDPRGNITTFAYDELFRLTSQRDPLGQVTAYTYDAVDNVIEKLDRLGRKTAYTYDQLNRPAQIKYADATVDYTYDIAYRLTRVDDTQSGSIVWAYDDADRLLSETTPQGVVSYTYNKANQRVSMTAADRSPVNYTYDPAGRLATIAQAGETFTYGYDTLSRVASLQRPNNVRTTYAYDNAYRLSRLTHTNGLNQALEDFQYTYNADDEIETINSLASATLLPTAKTVAPADAANRIAQFGTASYAFDNEGQTTTRTDAPTISNFTWDARGRLRRVSLSNGQSVDYTYDALGRRTSRTASGSITNFLYDDKDVVLDSRMDGATAEYLNGQKIDDKLRQRDSSSTNQLYFLQDRLASTLALTNMVGGITEMERYGAFGERTDGTFTRYGFTGREHDELTGLILYRTRWLDPQQGRFMSEDSIMFDGGINFYSYAANNPVTFTDPFGLARGDWWDPRTYLPDYDRAGQIANEELINHPGHNDAGDAMRHAEWSRRMRCEIGPFTAWSSGVGHEIDNLFEGAPLEEIIMDLHNNAEGRRAGGQSRPVDPNNLQNSPDFTWRNRLRQLLN
ncbi:MAG TPA: RHS repeat-associated core domain-containing protein [Pyrinomonadaceae bacterium]|nr:RHS repeat-associated core domain-containing protein [Pyrinomonadaceae bacterium]